MNMNRSGHSEMREPDWYSRSTDRAKLSPTTLETESTMQNSLTSLNFDSVAGAAFVDGNDHHSVRSLPVIPSSSASIASAVDAPWNESPRSFRGSYSASVLRTPSAAPAGVSTLDHLQNSISSITRPPITIITEEDDPLYLVEESTEGAGEEQSVASIQLNGTSGEMDATAHAGNVSRSSRMVVTTSAVLPPVSPMRSPMRQSRSWATHSNTHSYQSANGSVASRGSRVSRSFRHGRAPVNDEASLSTLGDGDDFRGEQDDDDDNLAIIKLLRNQVETLKTQLFAEQERNQQLKADALQSKSQSSFQMSYCSNSYNSFGHDCSSDGDSFGGDDNSSKGNKALPLPSDKFTTAQVSLLKSVESLRKSWEHRSRNDSPVAEDNEALMLDELTLCELEGHAKTMQQVYAEQQLDWQSQEERWRENMKRQNAKVKELKRQLAAKTAT